jgi:hypothetical protein
MKCIWSMTKHRWQNYKTNEHILSELKINPVVKKMQNYITKWVKYIRRMERGRLPCLIVIYHPCEKRSQERTIKRLRDF